MKSTLAMRQVLSAGVTPAPARTSARKSSRGASSMGSPKRIPPSVEARQAVRAMKTERNALGPIVVVVQRVPPKEFHAGRGAPRDDLGGGGRRHGDPDRGAMGVHEAEERAVGAQLVRRVRGVHL